ncbi:lipopolysaccharide biosynthesis protein [Agaricicola taiwanensis]|uniref:Lipopolysaccharide biosynthesis protein n=1 Tax=Agaricicola taiwanensis TaxID=591372 RepID=A0A8J2VML7_9RHOB|nr:lipopolysaccharide biosynthesis protein [Agaricicola taiwanensis]GGE30702.1 lipopolysaccharide biosynthesis protein [Agaricicola taiwanensis]
MGGVKQQFAAGSFWSLVGQGGANVVNFIIFAILARLLGPIEFGIVAFASVFIDLSRSLALGGFPAALIREKVWDQEAASTAFWGNLIFSITLVALVGIAGGHFLSGSYGHDFGLVLAALSASLVIDALRATHEAKLEREFQFKSLAKRTTFATIGAGIIGVVLAFAGFGVWALVINRIINSLIQTIIIWQAASWSPSWTFHRQKFAVMFRYGIHLSASAVFGQISRRVPELLAGLLISSTAVGFYKVGSRIVNFVFDLTITPMRKAAIAGFSRLEGDEALVRGYRSVTRAVSLIALPAFFGLAGLGGDLVVLLFGEKWAESGPVMFALCLFGGVAAINYFVQPLLAAAGKTHLASARSFVTLVADVVICFLAAPFGISAMAFGYAGRAYAGLVPTLALLRRAVGLPPLKALQDIFPPFLSATIMLAALIGLRLYVLTDLSRLLEVVILVPAGVVIYFGTLGLFFRSFIRSVWKDLHPLAAPALMRMGRAPQTAKTSMPPRTS